MSLFVYLFVNFTNLCLLHLLFQENNDMTSNNMQYHSVYRRQNFYYAVHKQDVVIKTDKMNFTHNLHPEFLS